MLDVQLPWELPGLDLLFGKDRYSVATPETLPKSIPVPVPTSLAEAALDPDPEQKAKRGCVTMSSVTCYRQVINFNLVEDEDTLDEVRWTRALEV